MLLFVVVCLFFFVVVLFLFFVFNVVSKCFLSQVIFLSTYEGAQWIIQLCVESTSYLFSVYKKLTYKAKNIVSDGTLAKRKYCPN